jgi:lysophospholipase L1-like esterase
MKIVCFGDSITRGVSFVKGRLRIIKENYPAFLQELFLNEIDPHVTVINKGVFNDNSDLLLLRLDRDVIQERPDYAIIGIGGNDCNFKWNEVAESPAEEHQSIVPIERYLDNVKKMITNLQRESIIPIVLTLPPLEPGRYYKTISEKYGNSIGHWISTTGGIEHWHGLYNHRLNNMINELEVDKVDVRTAIKKAGDLLEMISEDGIHLTASGYKAMSLEIYMYLKSLVGKELQYT